MIARGDNYHFYNHRGDVINVTDDVGNILLDHAYDAFGREMNDDRFSGYGHSGKDFNPETGLAYFGYRFYMPDVGRWLTRDPIRFAGGMNFYGYVGNNPINFYDSNGLWSEDVHNWILEEVFRGILTEDEIEILQRASVDVDEDQSIERSYMHAMRGPDQTVEEAEGLYNDFVCTRLRTAQRTRDRNAALYGLGRGMHALMDSTSPSHEGFQIWRGVGYAVRHPLETRRHYIQENENSEVPYGPTFRLLRNYYNAFTSHSDCQSAENEPEDK